MTVIDGATLSTATVAVGTAPLTVAVNPVTNKIDVTNRIYVPNLADNTVSVIAYPTAIGICDEFHGIDTHSVFPTLWTGQSRAVVRPFGLGSGSPTNNVCLKRRIIMASATQNRIED